jgi:hypothetical protein
MAPVQTGCPPNSSSSLVFAECPTELKGVFILQGMTPSGGAT